MSRIVRPRIIFLILTVATLILVGGYCWWWGYQVVDSLEIRNESDEKVYIVTGSSWDGCIGEVRAHSIGKLEVRRWSDNCHENLRFHFGDERLFHCSWEAAKQNQPVVVTATGASCEAD